jgi:sarcosine oxidase
VRGASHDHSRIIRRSYHTPEYVKLTAGAYDAWRSIEHDGGGEIITRTGGVDLFPPGAAIDEQSYRTSLAAEGVPFELLDGAEVHRRWPVFAGDAITNDLTAIYSEETGIVPAGRATVTMQQLARRHGADLRANTPVRAIVPVGDEVDVVTDDGAMHFDRVVVTADAWTNRLLAPLGHEIPLVVLREQVSYYPTDDLADFQPGKLPVWIWMDDPSFYGFPVYGDLTAVKGAEDCGGFEVDPDTRTFEPDAVMQDRLTTFMHRLFGRDFGNPLTKTCLYTLTSDRDFVCDRLPELPQIAVALGAGHGFKFAAWFGRVLADLSTDAPVTDQLGPFSFTRPQLHRAISREAWMV